MGIKNKERGGKFAAEERDRERITKKKPLGLEGEDGWKWMDEREVVRGPEMA